MYIRNDVCYADSSEKEIRVKTAKSLPGRMLLVTFESGEQRLFDTTKLTGSVFDALNDETIFRNITIFHGIITWKDGEIDIAPEFVYEESIRYNSPSDLTELVS